MEFIRYNYFTIIVMGVFFAVIGIIALFSGLRAIKKREITVASRTNVYNAVTVMPDGSWKHTGQEAIRLGKINMIIGLFLILLSLVSFLLLFYINLQTPIDW